MSAWPALLAIFVGGGTGSLLRWWLGLLLNPLFPTLPMGTLAANLTGGMLIGLASTYFEHNAALPPEWRLMVITGFLGGLTTFSTFSLEVVTLLARREYGWGLGAAGLHLLGSLGMTALGILLVSTLLAARH